MNSLHVFVWRHTLAGIGCIRRAERLRRRSNPKLERQMRGTRRTDDCNITATIRSDNGYLDLSIFC
jgi:hypothetical protein